MSKSKLKIRVVDTDSDIESMSDESSESESSSESDSPVEIEYESQSESESSDDPEEVIEVEDDIVCEIPLNACYSDFSDTDYSIRTDPPSEDFEVEDTSEPDSDEYRAKRNGEMAYVKYFHPEQYNGDYYEELRSDWKPDEDQPDFKNEEEDLGSSDPTRCPQDTDLDDDYDANCASTQEDESESESESDEEFNVEEVSREAYLLERCRTMCEARDRKTYETQLKELEKMKFEKDQQMALSQILMNLVTVLFFATKRKEPDTKVVDDEEVEHLSKKVRSIKLCEE